MPIMQIRINGQPHPIEDNLSLADLIQILGLQDKRLAIELNQSIIPRSLHQQTILSNGDQVEIIHAVGGG